MNKILLAGVLMFVGGFAIADVASLDLVGKIVHGSDDADLQMALVSEATSAAQKACVDQYKPQMDTFIAARKAFKATEKTFKEAEFKYYKVLRERSVCMAKARPSRTFDVKPTKTEDSSH